MLRSGGYPKKVKEVKVRYIVKSGLLYRISYPRRKRHPRRQLFVLTKQVDKEVEEGEDFDNCRRYGNKHVDTDSEKAKTKIDNVCDDNINSENERTKMDNVHDDNTDVRNEKTKMDNACDDNTDSENEKTKMDNACDDNTDSENEKTKVDNACDDNTDSENEKTKMDNACDDNTDSENEKPIWIMKVLLMLLQRIMMEQSHGISSQVEQHDEL